MNIETIARKLSLSNATVSRALRNCDGVNRKTRERVLKRAKELGYKAPARDASHGLVLLLPGNSINEVYELAGRYMLAIGDETAKLNWQFYPVAVPFDKIASLEKKDNWPSTIFNHNADCCIVVGDVSHKARVLLAKHFKENIVMLSRFYLEEGISGVCISDYSSALDATEKLYSLGHRNIGWVGALGSRSISRKRWGGVVSLLAEKDLQLNFEVWLNEREPLNIEVVGQAAQKILPADRSLWPTAWVAANDWIAANLMIWLESQGLSCPEDFSIICFDDTIIAENLAQRKISSMVTQSDFVARSAVSLLKQRWEKLITKPTAWVCPIKFRAGETLAPIKKRK